MGKEFKHPRRKCQICGYSVSYSNFKRHLRYGLTKLFFTSCLIFLRNAHPGEIDDTPMEGVEMLMEMELREGQQDGDSLRGDGEVRGLEDGG